MAFITKTVKRQEQNLATLVELVIQFFAGKGLQIIEEHISKNIEELEMKELIKTEGS